MYAVNVTIKVQNELAKKAIILALKDWSNDLFQNNGLMLRCFVDRTENQVEIFHVFRTKKEMEEVRTTKSNKFWEYVLSDNKVLVRYGKIGSKGTLSQTTYDSDENPFIPTLHTAFNDENTKPDALPRKSVEARVMCLIPRRKHQHANNSS